MTKRVFLFFNKLSRPIRAIEYIVSIGVLWAAALSVVFILVPGEHLRLGGGKGNPAKSSAFPEIIERYEIVTFFLIVMAVLAVLDIYQLSRKIVTKRSISIRAAATFGYTLGFVFVSVLTGLSVGIQNLLWVNEITLALISAVLYLNLRVNNENADR